MDGTARSTVRLVLLLGTTLGFLLTCKIPQNPLRAGSGTSTAAQLNHPINFGGHKHADGFCSPIDNCSACHGSSLQGGSHGEPSCTSCHGPLWTDPNCGKLSNIHTVNLGGVFHKPNYCLPYQNCSACHGVNLRGGSGGQPSCLSCHTQNNWKNCGSIQHTTSRDGVLHAIGTVTTVCVNCHGSDLRGGYNNEPSCYQCHGKTW